MAMLLLTATTIFSCKKDDGGGNTPGPAGNLNSIEQKIVGSWRVESKTTVHTNTNGTVTRTDQLDACEKDDTYTFKSDKTYTVNGGSMSCSYAMSYDQPFSWYVQAADSTFAFTHGPGLQTYPRIDQVDNTTLTISAQIGSSSTVDVYVYKRK